MLTADILSIESYMFPMIDGENISRQQYFPRLSNRERALWQPVGLAGEKIIAFNAIDY
jgi:hypothetical protein